jgi:hypothetical protein
MICLELTKWQARVGMRDATMQQAIQPSLLHGDTFI